MKIRLNRSVSIHGVVLRPGIVVEDERLIRFGEVLNEDGLTSESNGTEHPVVCEEDTVRSENTDTNKEQPKTRTTRRKK